MFVLVDVYVELVLVGDGLRLYMIDILVSFFKVIVIMIVIFRVYGVKNELMRIRKNCYYYLWMSGMNVDVIMNMKYIFMGYIFVRNRLFI